MNDKPSGVSERSPLTEPHADGIDFWGLLVRRKWIVAPLLACGLSVALAVYYASAPQFQSHAITLVQNSSRNVGVGSLRADGDVDTDMKTQIVLVRSPRIVARAVREHNLASLPSLAGQVDPVQAVMQGLTAYHHEETQGVLEVAYTGTHPQDCQTIVNAIVDSYGQFLRDTHRSVNEETVQFITKAKDELLQELNDAEAHYREFKKNAPPVLIGTDGEGGNIHRMRLASIEQQRQQLLLKRTQLSGQILAIENARRKGGNEEVLAFVVGNMQTSDKMGHPQTIAEQIFPLMLEEHRLLRKFGPDHPQVMDVREQIEFTRSFLDGLVLDPNDKSGRERPDFLSIYVASLKQQIQINLDQETELNKQFEQEQLASKQSLILEAQHEAFRNDIQRKKALFDAIVQRLGEMNVLKDFGGFTMEVVTDATAAVQVGPSLVRHVGFGALGGFVLALLIAFWRERCDRRFRAPEDIYDQLGASVVSHIPSMPLKKLQTTAAESAIDGSVCTFHQPQSQWAEAFRAVRVALYFSSQREANKVIQVTSPTPGDGKSTLSANLAVSIAHSGKRVLLVEGDFRRPRVHELFGIDSPLGLPALLSGRAELDDVIHETEVANLSAVPCGELPQNPAELLASERFVEFLETVRSLYDFVILDTPPVMAVTDPSIIASHVDGIYLAMRLRKNTRPAATRAAEMLHSVGGKLLGVVVNGAGQKRQYGYGYANHSSYGRSSYGPSRYGYYGYGASVKEAAGYYAVPAKPPKSRERVAAASLAE